MKARYERFVIGYKIFARMRGFHTFNDWPYHRRGFIECWAEPGFHRFWQIWNPGIAYFVYRLYLSLGGRRRWIFPTLFSFIFCGVAHTVIVFPFFGHWSFSVIGAFICFGVLTVLSKKFSRLLRQDRWPRLFNAAMNIGLMLISFNLGFKLDRLLS